jgi:catechol 2,3-dioxygenase-like lactoylglutathione lyase family enzyme
MKLSKMMIFVPDLAKAREFYSTALGFEVDSESKDSLSFRGAGCEFVAYKCEKTTKAADYAKEARSVFVFEVPDLDVAVQSLRAKNVIVLHSTPGENESGRYAAFVDPFGIVHEIFEAKKRL